MSWFMAILDGGHFGLWPFWLELDLSIILVDPLCFPTIVGAPSVVMPQSLSSLSSNFTINHFTFSLDISGTICAYWARLQKIIRQDPMKIRDSLSIFLFLTAVIGVAIFVSVRGIISLKENYTSNNSRMKEKGIYV